MRERAGASATALASWSATAPSKPRYWHTASATGCPQSLPLFMQ